MSRWRTADSRARAVALWSLVAAAGCSGGAPSTLASDTGALADARDGGSRPTDARPPTDAAHHVGPHPDAAGDVDAPAAPAALHGCVDFADRRAADADRTVRFDSSPSLAYTPPCIAIAAGQTVAFEGPFARHSLAPGRSPLRTSEPEGSPANPIPPTESGTRVEVAFDAAGTFPFYCATHDLAGMVGVVRVE